MMMVEAVAVGISPAVVSLAIFVLQVRTCFLCFLYLHFSFVFVFPFSGSSFAERGSLSRSHYLDSSIHSLMENENAKMKVLESAILERCF